MLVARNSNNFSANRKANKADISHARQDIGVIIKEIELLNDIMNHQTKLCMKQDNLSFKDA